MQIIAAEMPEVDAVVGIGSNKAIPAIIEPGLCGGRRDQVECYGPKSDIPLGGDARHLHPASLCLSENRRGLQQPLPLLAIPADSRPAAQPPAWRTAWPRPAGWPTRA